MINKDSPERQLWKDAYMLRDELTPPPKRPDSDAFWSVARKKVNACYGKYEHTSLRVLAEYMLLGILLQLEQESIAAEGATPEDVAELVRATADKLKIS